MNRRVWPRCAATVSAARLAARFWEISYSAILILCLDRVSVLVEQAAEEWRCNGSVDRPGSGHRTVEARQGGSPCLFVLIPVRYLSKGDRYRAEVVIAGRRQRAVVVLPGVGRQQFSSSPIPDAFGYQRVCDAPLLSHVHRVPEQGDKPGDRPFTRTQLAELLCRHNHLGTSFFLASSMVRSIPTVGPGATETRPSEK